jgi:hypothetical protein
MFNHVNTTVKDIRWNRKAQSNKRLTRLYFSRIIKDDMTKCVDTMIDEFPYKLTGVSECAWNGNHFKFDPNASKLNKEQAAMFHTFVMKDMFLCKRGRQDIQPGIAF